MTKERRDLLERIVNEWDTIDDLLEKLNRLLTIAEMKRFRGGPEAYAVGLDVSVGRGQVADGGPAVVEKYEAWAASKRAGELVSTANETILAAVVGGVQNAIAGLERRRADLSGVEGGDS